MRKKILMLLTLFAGVVTATADNTVSVGTALIPQGKTGTFSIELTNTDAFASSMEVHLTLPEGITFEGVALSDRFTDNPSLSNSTSGQSVTITTLSGANAAITGNSGPLLNITVSAAADLDAGTKLTGSVTKMELAKKVGDKHEKWNPDAFDFDIEITDRVILDENSTVAPTAQSNVDVLVKRTIKAGQWSTIVLPFTLTKTKAQSVFGNDVELAEFDGFEVDYGDDEENVTPLGIVINLKSYTIPSRGGWAGGKPLLIKVSSDIESFEVNDVNITDKVNAVSKADEYETLGVLTGSFVKTTIPADGLFINNNQFWYSTGKTKVKAFRCWFELGAVLDKETEFASRISMKFTDDSDPTGIHVITNDESRVTNAVYDLQGRQIVNGQLVNRKFAKGLYIVNGKKVLNN